MSDNRKNALMRRIQMYGFTAHECALYLDCHLMYHALVLMADMDISVDDILKELASRHVIDKKVKQEKMV